jgi:signal transduction histidine kinase
VPGAVVELQGFGETLADVLISASFFAMLLSISLGSVALVLRVRRSTGQQRLQLRWIATGAAVLAVTFVVFAVSQLIDPRATPWILPEATCLAYIFFSVTVGVAIFRYRLYDIDVILNRAIVLGTLAVFVSVGYIVVVVAIGAVLQAVGAPGSTLYWPSLVATALVAVAFQPVRRHVLRLADRLVYGNRAAPYEALATLSRRLADSPSPDALPSRVAEATGRAVGAAGMVVRLGRPGESAELRSAAWTDTDSTPGPDRIAGATLVLAVLDAGEQVGSIEVTMPPGRALRTFERDLLQDVAAQAGVAFRNALLEAELTARVEQGEALAAELSASRRRLLGVEDEARERLAGAIRRNVVPHLAAVDAELTAGPADDQSRPDHLEPLIDEVEHAQQELRTVCRGLFPALLDRRGLIPALSAQLDLTHPHTRLDVDKTADRRLDRAVEAAGYLFCVQVAPTERRSTIQLRVDDDRLIATVTADSDWAHETGEAGRATIPAAWQHSRDRVAALDGAMNLQRNDSGLAVTAVIPLHPEEGGEHAAAVNGPSNSPSPPHH